MVKSKERYLDGHDECAGYIIHPTIGVAEVLQWQNLYHPNCIINYCCRKDDVGGVFVRGEVREMLEDWRGPEMFEGSRIDVLESSRSGKKLFGDYRPPARCVIHGVRVDW